MSRIGPAALSEPVERLAPLGRLLRLPLFGLVLLVAALGALALVSVDALRDHVDRWSWTDSIADRHAALERLLAAHAKDAGDIPRADVLAAFDRLDGAILREGGDVDLAGKLLGETAAARRAFLKDQSQQDIAEAELLELTRTADTVASLITNEIEAARAAEFRSSLASSEQEDAQRRRVARVMQIADLTIVAQQLRSQVKALADFPKVARDGAEIDTSRLPAGCLGAGISPIPTECTPSPARALVTIAKLNEASGEKDTSAAARDALWAINAYLRGLRAVFENKSEALNESIDALEEERSITSAITRRRSGLNRMAGVLADVREQVDSLPFTGAQQIDAAFATMRASMVNLRQRGQALFSAQAVGADKAERFLKSIAALKAAWSRAVDAMKARYASAGEMASALRRMQERVAREAGRLRGNASSWIDMFTSTTVTAFGLFGLIVSLGALLADRLIAQPIAKLNRLILRLGDGNDRQPIEESEGGRSLRPLFEALEKLRLSSKARRLAENSAAAAAREVERAHGRLNRIANSAPAGLYELEMRADGRMELPYYSGKFQQLLAVGGDDERSAESVFARVHPDDSGGLFDALRASAQTLEPLQLRHRVVHPSRGVIWLSNASFPVSDRAGVVHWAGTVADVTDEVRHESELDAARVKAEAANQAKSQFLANMSHEIRTPMNGIIGMCDLLQTTEMTAEQRSCLETVNSSAESLLSIIGDVLDLSKVEAGRLERRAESFSPRSLIHDIGGFLGPRLREKRLDFSIDHDDRIGRRIGDPGKLRQIIVNLLGNAIKFTQSGHVAVTLRPGDGDDVVISVRDTGVGIAPADLEAVFEPFHQVDNTFTRAHDGTGLGLAIARRLAALLDGEITLSSKPGHGATFSLRVPLPPDPAAASEVPGPQLAGKTVLLVETSALNRTVLETQFATLGARVIVAANGAEALELRHTSPEPAAIDLAVIGHQLPDWDPTYLSNRLNLSGMPPVPCLLNGPVDLALRRDAVKGERMAGLLICPSPTPDVATTALAAMSVGSSASAPNPASAPAQTPHTDKAFGQLKIMAAEDNRTNQIILQRMIESLTGKVEIFDNGLAVCEAFESAGADIVFMDISMPVMDGLEATRRIRAFEGSSGRKPCAIIALTAHASNEQHADCLKAGIDKVVTKPIRRGVIQSALEDASVRIADATPHAERAAG